MIPPPRIPWWTTFALTGAAGLMLAVFLAPRHGLPVLARPAADRDVLRVAYVQRLLTDPHVMGAAIPVQNQFTLGLWEPLIECDPETGQPMPAAAESWRWSDDRLTLTVTLRSDGRWSNGDPVTAQDFVRGWQRLVLEGRDGAAVLFPVKHAEAINHRRMADVSALGVEAVDDRTLRITLDAVRSTFVAELADPLLVPLHRTTVAVLREKRHFHAPEALVTNGAFRLTEVAADGFRFGLSPHHRDRASLRLGGVEFVRVENAHMARLLLAVGRVDVANPLPAGPAAVLPTARCVTEVSETSLSITALALNIARGPLRDVRVRRALALALDRADSIPEDDADRVMPAYAWVPDMPGRPSLNLFQENAAEARRLLAEAGYPGGRGFPVLVWPVLARRMNYSYVQAWSDRLHRELGIRTYLSYGLPERHWPRMRQGDYDLVVIGMLATVPDAGDLLSIFAHPERFNLPQWADHKITQALTEANRKSGAGRLVLLEQLERRIMDGVPVIPLMFERRRALLAVEVEGWYPDPLARQALKRLAINPTLYGTPRKEEAL